MTRCLQTLRQTLLIPVFVIALSAFCATSYAQGCTSSWSKSQYKSYSQIRAEVQQRVRNAQILSVQLCGRGASARFRVRVKTRSNGGATRRDIIIRAR